MAVYPLFGRGFIPTHDGEYHIIRFWQFSKMIDAGSSFPRWAPDLNSGYGLPLFIFHYPFANYVAYLFHQFGVSFVDAFKLVLATGYLVAIGGCFIWLSKLFSRPGAIAGSVVCAMAPYWFVDIYVRGSVGEVWAIAWLFVGFAATERSNVLVMTLASALLILSHNIMAMLLVPFFLLYIVLRKRQYVWAPLVGIFLSCYFWMPALLESVFVDGLNSVAYADHFPLLVQMLIPSWGTGFSVRELTSSEMSYQIGIIPLVVALLMAWKHSDPDKRSINRLFVAIGLMAFFLMLEVSKPIWAVSLVLPLIQYPWRLLVFVLPLSAFWAAWVVSRYPQWVGIFLILSSFGASLKYMRPVIYASRNDMYYQTRREFTDGTSSLGNTFSSVWTEWKRNRPQKKVEIRSGRASVGDQHLTTRAHTFTVISDGSADVAINTLYYPGWTLLVDNVPTPIEYKKEGIVQFRIADGTHTVSLQFRETLLRKIADSISLLSLLWLWVWAILRVTRRQSLSGLMYAHRNKHRSVVRRA